MKVLTNNPVYIDDNPRGTMYSNLDGKSSSKEIKSFQNYVEAKHGEYAETTGYGAYGKWDAKTQAAWNKFGSQFEAFLTSKKTKKEVKEFVETETKKVKKDVKKKVGEVEKELEKEKESGWKGMPKGVKMAIIGGGAAVLILITVIALSGSGKKAE